jgi:hypothetical protein
VQTRATTNADITEIVGNLEQPALNWRKFIVVPPWLWVTLYGVATVAWVSAITWGGYRGAYWLLS